MKLFSNSADCGNSGVLFIHYAEPNQDFYMNKETFAVIIRRNRWRELRDKINLYTVQGWSMVSISRSFGDAIILFERDTP